MSHEQKGKEAWGSWGSPRLFLDHASVTETNPPPIATPVRYLERGDRSIIDALDRQAPRRSRARSPASRPVISTSSVSFFWKRCTTSVLLICTSAVVLAGVGGGDESWSAIDGGSPKTLWETRNFLLCGPPIVQFCAQIEAFERNLGD